MTLASPSPTLRWAKVLRVFTREKYNATALAHGRHVVAAVVSLAATHQFTKRSMRPFNMWLRRRKKGPHWLISLNDCFRTSVASLVLNTNSSIERTSGRLRHGNRKSCCQVSRGPVLLAKAAAQGIGVLLSPPSSGASGGNGLNVQNTFLQATEETGGGVHALRCSCDKRTIEFYCSAELRLSNIMQTPYSTFAPQKETPRECASQIETPTDSWDDVRHLSSLWPLDKTRCLKFSSIALKPFLKKSRLRWSLMNKDGEPPCTFSLGLSTCEQTEPMTEEERRAFIERNKPNERLESKYLDPLKAYKVQGQKGWPATERASLKSNLSNPPTSEQIKERNFTEFVWGENELPFSPTFVLRPDPSNLPKPDTQDALIRRWAATFVAYHAAKREFADCQLALDLRISSQDGGLPLVQATLARLKMAHRGTEIHADLERAFDVIKGSMEALPTDAKPGEKPVTRAPETRVQLRVLEASAAAAFGVTLSDVASYASNAAVGGRSAGYSTTLPLLAVPLAAYMRHRAGV